MILKNIFDISRPLHALFFIAAAVIVVYSASLSGGFVWDDGMNISSNTFIHDRKNIPLIFSRKYLTSPDQLHLIGQEMVGAGEASYRPVVTATYFLDYAVWKLNPFGYRLTNLILHIFCVSLLYVLLGRFIRHRGAVFWAALVFAVHPVQTEAVIAPSMREDILAALFYLLTLILYFDFFHRRRYGNSALIYGVMLAVYGLGLFSKEMAVTLPVMFWMMDVFLRKERFNWSVIFQKRYWGFYAVTAAYLYIWKFVMGRPEGFSAEYPGGSFYTNILAMLKVAGIYFDWIIAAPWTVKPTFSPGSDFIAVSFWSPRVAESLLILLCLTLAVSVVSRKIPLMRLSAWWFVIALFPVMNIIPLQNIFAARFLYLPMAAAALGCGLFLEALFEKRFSIKCSADFLTACLSILIIFYSAVTWTARIRWKNEFIFRLVAAQEYPLHLSTRIGLAHAYRNQMNNPVKAIEQFLIAKAIDPDYIRNYIDLAVEYRKIDDHDSAIRALQEAVARRPDDISLRDMLCVAQGNAGRVQEAEKCFEVMLALDPQHFKSYRDLHTCHVLSGDSRKAAAVVVRALWFSGIRPRR